MLSIVDASGEVLSGLVSGSVYSAIMRNIARQKRDFSKKREEWLQRVIKAHLVLAIVASLLSPAQASQASPIQENTEWDTYFRSLAATFNEMVAQTRNKIIMSSVTEIINLCWYMLSNTPCWTCSTIEFIFYTVPMTCWTEGDYISAFFNLLLILAISYAAYFMLCYGIIALCTAWRVNRMAIRNAATLSRELPWILYNWIVFWRKPFVVLGGEDHVTAKSSFDKNGKRVIKVYLRGKEIQTIVDKESAMAKEMAFPGTKAHKVQSLSNEMLRSQVLFYCKSSNEFVFVGQGTVVAIKCMDGPTRNYVLTAAHVADAATHFSAACTHGSAGQRFQELGTFVIKTAYRTPEELDLCAFEVSQSQLSKASLPTYPSLRPCNPCNSRDCYVTEDDVLECIGLGDPHSSGEGFYHSSGKVVDSPVPHGYILGHKASTKHGWSGCGLFRRHGTSLNLAGIHTGRIDQANSFILVEEVEEYLARDYWMGLMAKESQTRKNRKGGGRRGADADAARNDRVRFMAGTGDYSGYTKDSALSASAKESATQEEPTQVGKPKSAAMNALLGLKKHEDALAEAKAILAKAQAAKPAAEIPPFRAPATKPQAGAAAVNGNSKENPRVTFSSQKPTTSSFQFPISGREGSKLSALALGRLTKLNPSRVMSGSEQSSETSSPTSKRSSTTPDSPRTTSSKASSNTTPTSTEELESERPIGKQRSKLIQSVTQTLALSGASACTMDWIKQGSNQSLKELGKLLSTAQTANPPQGTPTDSTSKPTEASSTKLKASSRTKSSPGSQESTSARASSTPINRLGRGGSRRA